MNVPDLLDNYDMALRRLYNTEKRLLKNRGQSIRGGHQQGSPTNSKDTGDHVASRERRVNV